jgi:hypothetical protein
MSRGGGTESAECLDGGVPASDAILCYGTGNDCGESENCETRAGTTGFGELDASARIGGDGLWRGGCIGCVTAGHVDLNVFGVGSACMCA